MANPNPPDFTAGAGYTALTRGIPKNGDIRHYGDNFPSVIAQTGIVPGNPTPGTAPNATEIPTPDLDNPFLPGSATAHTLDAQKSVSFTAAGTAGGQNGYAIQGGGTIGGGDASNEGFDAYSSKL